MPALTKWWIAGEFSESSAITTVNLEDQTGQASLPPKADRLLLALAYR
jgi:hypothetical protein